MARMSSYAPLPVGDPDEIHNAEMEAAFDDSDSDNDDERRPLAPSSRHTNHVSAPSVGQSNSATYDFTRQDDWIAPPPGSPPRPSARALPNDIGNSNGLIPTSPPSHNVPSRPWFSRFIPSRFTSSQRPSGLVGSGANNDGVFANVTAKPTRPNMVETTAADGSIHLAPEESSSAPPPSYQSAQADAVPPYWETTVHIMGFAGQNLTVGELIIDSLPTGSLMSFLWNMLVSVSFQFVGFLLTYLLHSTHAARLGSRAGLGITLIQYGFSLRRDLDDPGLTNQEANEAWDRIEEWRTSMAANFSSAADADAYFQNNNATIPGLTEEQANALIADATSEWLSFFLMTVGWFVFLTSILQFFRVKRWERGIIASQLENPNANDRPTGESPVLSRIQRAFGLPPGVSYREFFQRGLGLRRDQERADQEDNLRRVEEGIAEVAPPPPPSHNSRPSVIMHSQSDREDDSDDDELDLETDHMIPMTEEQREALDNDRRVYAQLRQAGFL